MRFMRKYIWFLLGIAFWGLYACSDDAINPVDGADGPELPEEEGRPAITFESRGLYVSYNPLETGFGSNYSKVQYGKEEGALISWKWMKDDPDDAAYDIYRSVAGGTFEKLNVEPIATTTNFSDKTIDITKTNTYQLRFAGSEEILASYEFTPAMAATFYRRIPLNMNNLPDSKGDPYFVSDAAVADLDGDGEYEIVIKRQTKSIDNSFGGGMNVEDPETAWANGSAFLEAYDLTTGAFMWRVVLGPNIRQGTHYIPFIVYDLDGDGRAELAVRTSEQTKFGDGTEIGDVDGDGLTYYVDTEPTSDTYGKIVKGPEFLSIIDGLTGAELARTNYIPRGDQADWNDYWGDETGNRMDRFLMAVGHFAGINNAPSIVMCRGYYKNFQLVALDYNNGELKERWHFNTDPGWNDYNEQGNHNLAVGDVDNDGKDEIIYGACAFDHNGIGLYTTGLGHGDALHLGKFDPSREGLQVFACHEDPQSYGNMGAELHDAATGEILAYLPVSNEDVGRCMVADIDPETPGCELWASGPQGKLFSCKGEELVGKSVPVYKPNPTAYSYNFGIWWSGSLNRQLLDSEGCVVVAYGGEENQLFAGANNYNSTPAHGTKYNPSIYADLWGDWREEMIYPSKNMDALHIFTTNIKTDYRFRPLMNDHTYRMSVAHQNVGYNQPTHTGFYLGSDLEKNKR